MSESNNIHDNPPEGDTEGTWDDDVTQDDLAGQGDLQEDSPQPDQESSSPKTKQAGNSIPPPSPSEADPAAAAAAAAKSRGSRKIQQRSRRTKLNNQPQTPPSSPANKAPPQPQKPPPPKPARTAAAPKPSHNAALPDDDVGDDDDDDEEDDDDIPLDEGHSPLVTGLCAMWEGLKALAQGVAQGVWRAITTVYLSIQVYLPYLTGVAVSLLIIYLAATYLVSPALEHESKDWAARVQYLLRAGVWSLLPVALGLLPWLEDRGWVYESLQEAVLLCINSLLLLPQLEDQCLHWLWTALLVLALTRLVAFSTFSFTCTWLQQCLGAPGHFTLVALTLYNFTTVLGQDLGFVDQSTALQMKEAAAAAQTEEEERPAGWADLSMCYVMERMFCDVGGSAHTHNKQQH